MQPVIEARAPGKLVIVGEYAVLHGAPGISVAVDVCALARLELITGLGSELCISGSGERFGFHWGVAAKPRWTGLSPGAFGLPLESCIATLGAHGLLPQPEELPVCRIELDTSAFHGSDAAGQRIKLGLGSSAAVLVALMGALLKFVRAAPLPQDRLIALCCAAHRHLQGGIGSGIDVATAVTGGVISVDFTPTSDIPHASSLAWPRKLHMLAVWSGASASTPAMLGRLQRYREQQAAACTAHMAQLGAISAQAVTAWREEDTGAVLEALDSYASALRNLDQAAGIGIYSDRHAALRDIALAHGAVYKTSGAGGGDFGIALSTSQQLQSALRQVYTAGGHMCLAAGLCPPGLQVQAGNQGT